ncbi:cation:proton antiporter [Candidatus Micrarchaeota archaeon]|nr:cation:proton antiporter [Candidatus Micrarchaeota archaeon]
MVAETAAIPIVEIGVIVLAALFFGIIASRFRLPTSIGYILAGFLLGPQIFGFLTPSEGIAQLFGEIGLLLLLFYLGLELSVKRFKESGSLATMLSLVEMGIPFIFAFAVALVFGFSLVESLVIGAMLTATSTVMVSKFMFDRRIEKEPESRLGISILVVEDFFAILVLAFLFSISNAVSFKQTLLNGILFVIAMFFLVSRVTRFVSRFFERHGRTSIMTLFALGVGIMVAYFSSYLGLTIALGAYFAGFALTETPFGERVKKEIGFMREFFILFFFVGFGTTVTMPAASSLLLVAALVASYVVAKLIAYGFFATSLGLSTNSAIRLGMMMIPIGEFSLIIAAASAPFVRNGSEIISIAFLLTIVSTVISPVLFDRSKQIAGALSSVYPKRLRRSLSTLGKDVHSFEKASQNPAFQNEFSRSAQSFLVNSIVALAIVYMSFLASFNVDLSFIPFLPKQVSINLLILPLVFWPIYKAINDLKFIAYSSVSRWSGAHFPYWRRHHDAGMAAAEIITSFVLTLVGIFASILFYLTSPELLLVPLLFTLLALMYLSKSIYSLFEQAEDLESLSGSGGAADKEILSLSRELAVGAGKILKARSELQRFKKREGEIIQKLGGIEKRLERREVAELSKEEVQTKKALEQYFLKQAPRILEEKRKAAKKAEGKRGNKR